MQKAGFKLFEKHLEKYAPADPVYETYTDKRGKQKRRKRQLPLGLSARDQKILKSVNKRARILDKGFSICGMRFGWTFIIGIVPGAGDVADAALNYFLVVRKARQADIPSWLLRRMLANNAVSVAVGVIPVAGDFILAAFKANSRNAELLHEFLRIRGEEFLKMQAEQAGKNNAPVANPHNVEQVQPGAGTEPGEVVPGEVTGNGKKRSLSKWMGGSRAKADPAGSQGRFVENVDEKKK